MQTTSLEALKHRGEEGAFTLTSGGYVLFEANALTRQGGGCVLANHVCSLPLPSNVNTREGRGAFTDEMTHHIFIIKLTCAENAESIVSLCTRKKSKI